MSDPKISDHGDTGLRVSIEQNRPRQAADTSFGQVMSDGLGRSADTMPQTGQIAAPSIAGGAVLSAALAGVGAPHRSVAGGQTATSAGALSGVASEADRVGLGGKGAAAGGVGTSGAAASGGDLLDKMQRLQEINQSFNLQYLMLQQKMQDEGRRFSVISNIMKTRHDAAKNSIANLR